MDAQKVLSEFSLGLTPFKLDTSTSADSAAGATNFRDAVVRQGFAMWCIY
jgi:hypothetical protein